MVRRVGPDGEVVVALEVLDRAGIASGDEVVVEAVDGGVRIRRRRTAADLRGLLGPAVGLADLEVDRRHERERDDVE